MTPPKLPRLPESVHSSPSTLLLILGTFVIFTILLTSEQSFFVQNVAASVVETNDEIRCVNDTKDLITVPSQFGVTETVARLQVEIQAHDLGIISVFDHAFAADTYSQPLRPTTLVLFDGPTISPLLLQSEQLIGIDLPLKYLVWQDACGQVFIGYTEISALQKRHQITEDGNTFSNLAELLDSIAVASALDL